MKYLSATNNIKGLNLANGVSFDPLNMSVGVALVSSKKMRELNRDFRGIDRVTDVLSFSQLEGYLPNGGTFELGDIVISPTQALKQALESGETLEREIDRLLIHGLLHLIGYDHEKNAYQARKMRAMEKEILLAVAKVDGKRE